jgi:hypothetical protein
MLLDHPGIVVAKVLGDPLVRCARPDRRASDSFRLRSQNKP